MSIDSAIEEQVRRWSMLGLLVAALWGCERGQAGGKTRASNSAPVASPAVAARGAASTHEAPATPRSARPATSSAPDSHPALTAAQSAQGAEKCARVEQHELGVLRAASQRALVQLQGTPTPNLARDRKLIRQALAAQGKTLRAEGHELEVSQLTDRHVQLMVVLLSKPYTLPFALEQQGRLAKAAVLAQAFIAHAPIPMIDVGELEVKFCRVDAKGVWAVWTQAANYVPDGDEWLRWRAARVVRVARLTRDGRTLLAKQIPIVSDPTPTAAGFQAPPHANCCHNNYSHGGPEIAFVHDQTGDGIPELALKASWHVEGSSVLSGMVYEERGAKLVEQDFDFSSVEDVDGDGRLDLLMEDSILVGEDCDTSFGVDAISPIYVAHARPDGSYVFDDSVARDYARRACPEAPKSFRTDTELWCAKVWSVPTARVLSAIEKHCRPEPCQGDPNTPVCAWSQAAFLGFKPPFQLP